VLRPDPARVLVRPFLPASEPRRSGQPDSARALVQPMLPSTEPNYAGPTEPCRITRTTNRVLAMDPIQVEAELADVMRGFGSRHAGLRATFADRFTQLCGMMPTLPAVPEEARQLLIGAYFSLEYSYEAAALFNPSMVPHPDQDGLAPGEVRFVLSLRATGEGHISSICFRSGTLDASGDLRLDPPGVHATTPYWNSPVQADGGCEVAFPPGSLLAERVLFPIVNRH